MTSSAAPLVAHHFEDAAQQREAATLGMWIFLATEIMFFGGMIAAYVVYRYNYDRGFHAAAQHMHKGLGTINTAILLTSSFTAALAVYFAKMRRIRPLFWCCVATLTLGIVFDGLKFHEYADHISQNLLPGPNFHFPEPYTRMAFLFFVLYFVLTAVHAIHVAIGCGAFGVLAVRSRRGDFTNGHPTLVENIALYWHFVDLVWIFLYPMFYLAGEGS